MLNPIKFLKRLVKSSNQIELDRLQKILAKVNELEETIRGILNELYTNCQTKYLEAVDALYSNFIIEQQTQQSEVLQPSRD